MKRQDRPPKSNTQAKQLVSQHGEVKEIERVTRVGIAAVKMTDPAKGASLSSTATTVLFTIDEDALRGRKIVTSARSGHESVHGTEEEKKRRWLEDQEEVNRLCKEHPEWSWAEIKRRAAINRRCNAKTIDRHCNDPRK
jgi:hypothetical protein